MVRAQQQLKLWHAVPQVELVLGFACVLRLTAARKSYQKAQKECLLRESSGWSAQVEYRGGTADLTLSRVQRSKSAIKPLFCK